MRTHEHAFPVPWRTAIAHSSLWNVQRSARVFHNLGPLTIWEEHGGTLDRAQGSVCVCEFLIGRAALPVPSGRRFVNFRISYVLIHAW